MTSTTWQRIDPPRAGHFVVDALGAFPVDLGDLDECAMLGEESGDAGADAVATARDDRDSSVEEPIPVVDTRDTVVTHSVGP